MVVIGKREVDRIVKIGRKGVLVEPAAILVGLEHETQQGILFESEPVGELAMLETGLERNRLDQAEGAEPDVCDPVLFVQGYDQEPMASGRDCLRAEQNSRGCRVDPKVECFQQQLEQPVQFETVPATASMDDLLEQIDRSQRNVLAEVNIQVLERYMEHVLPM